MLGLFCNGKQANHLYTAIGSGFEFVNLLIYLLSLVSYCYNVLYVTWLIKTVTHVFIAHTIL